MRSSSICLLLLLTSICFAEVLNVPSSQYPSIQQAINHAITGDTIIVAPGRYYENINFLGKAITVRSTDPNNPNIAAVTIIDGNRPADINYASTVTFKTGETSASTIEGFTITGGTGSWLQIYWEFKGTIWNRCGGGIVCSNYSSPTISKNIITKNLAGEGGGIYCYDHSNVTISDNTISDNNALINHGFADPNPNDPNIYDHGDGGAIVCFQYCNAAITNNTIQHNNAYYYGGGIHFRQWSTGLIENNLITQNSSMLGAGIHITYTSAPTVRKNTITANTASGLGGGGIYIYYYSNPLVEQNLVMQNSSENGAGIGIYWDSNPVVRNNFIVNNLLGAGIRIVSLTPIITNNTISFNGMGGIQYENTASPIITNNIITSNGRWQGINASSTTGIIKYNNVWGNSAGNYNSLIGDLTGINGNISQNPLFAGTGNYHILPQSPCVNAGDSNAVNGEFDIDNEERIFNSRIDIGADECVTNASDFNNDGIVDFEDLFEFSQNWLAAAGNSPADFVDDNFIDFADFAIFAENWLWTAKWR
jgi:parallel beta-helix repeat protein